jgi:COP9 signalosome complex subunit 1
MCSGLAALRQRDMRSAAAHFLSVPAPLCSARGAMLLHANELAVYAVMASIASMQRDELQLNFMGAEARGKPLLDEVPELRDVVLSLVACNYAAALKAADALMPVLECDLYLQPVLGSVFHLLRRQCIVQYVQPYSAVDLSAMASVLSMPIGELEHELVQLIGSGDIRMRIDSLHHVS